MFEAMDYSGGVRSGYTGDECYAGDHGGRGDDAWFEDVSFYSGESVSRGDEGI